MLEGTTYTNVTTDNTTTVRHEVDISGLLGFALILGLALIGAADPEAFWGLWQ